MIVAEKEDLTPVKVLINNTEIQLTLLEDRKGNIFVSATSSQPEGIVYFATTPSSLCLFFESCMPLQTLLDKSPSIFVEINNNSKKVLYSTRDLQVKLKCGEQTINQLTGNCPVEIWKGISNE
jgi:hypothetical protein